MHGPTAEPRRALRALALLALVLCAPAPLPAQPAAAPPAVADSALPDTLPADSPAAVGDAARALVAAQEATPETALVAPREAIPVFLGGREVFRVRAGRDGLAPAERAAAIRTRLTRAVADPDAPADSVRLLATPEGIEVRLGRYFLWLITPGDVDDEGPAELAARMAGLPAEVRDGIERERSSRRPLRILISIGIALLLTLVALALARGITALVRRWHAWLDGTLPRYARGIGFRGFELLSQAQVAGILRGILGRVDVIAWVLLVYFYLTAVFSLFPWTQGWSWLLLDFAITQVVQLARGVGSAIPGLTVIAIILLLFRWLTNLSDRFFDAIAAGTLSLPGFHAELAKPSKRLVRILLWIVAIMVSYPYIPGAQTRAVQGVSILLGVMVSIGSTGVVGNVIAGIVLTYSRAFRTGDRVRIGDHTGDIVSLGFFATKLRTIRNEEITLPNGQVATTAIVNYTRLAEDPGLVLYTEVTIGYDVDWRKVHAMLIEAAGKVEGLEKEPPPVVYQRSLNDYHVSYELNVVTHHSHPQIRLYSRLHEEIQDVFAREGIEILSPGFHAIRDANAPVLPASPAGPRPAPGAFRVNRGDA